MLLRCIAPVPPVPQQVHSRRQFPGARAGAEGAGTGHVPSCGQGLSGGTEELVALAVTSAACPEGVCACVRCVVCVCVCVCEERGREGGGEIWPALSLNNEADTILALPTLPLRDIRNLAGRG